MIRFVLALVLLLSLAVSAEATGRVVVRRGAFGRSVVVQRGFVPQHSFSRGVIVDPGFRSFHGGNVVIDQFGRAVIIR